MTRKPIITLCTLCTLAASAQTEWTAQQCMSYAVEHNTHVRRAELELDNYKAARLSAVGNFLPSASASVGSQYNFGRAIDPATNGYTDVTTFYNGYSAHVSLPVFDGFSRLHALRAAKASVLMGRHALREQQDQTALSTLQAWADVIYYAGTVTMAEERLHEADLTLHQTQLMVEVGRKSAADLAQMEAQQAEASYELTRQQNLLTSAKLQLKREMGYPLTDSLNLATGIPHPSSLLPLGGKATGRRASLGNGREGASLLMPTYLSMQIRQHELRQAKSAFMPSISVSAGLSTTYYTTLHTHTAAPFHEQLRNNMGEYVSASLSIPLFSGFSRVSNMRRARNNYLIAREAYFDKQTELEKLSLEACNDLEAYTRQIQQMQKKVEADSLAYQLTRRQYDEGLSTAIDLHSTAAALLQSRATLLQCRLMAMLKHELIRYYNGECIWTEPL